jgi:hypothetical protein
MSVENDVAIGRSIAVLLARDDTAGLNLPGVARLLYRLCDAAERAPLVTRSACSDVQAHHEPTKTRERS